MRIALLENRRSGDGEAGEVAEMISEAGAEVESFDHIEAEAEDVRSSGAERLVIAGGDGSIGPAAAMAAELGIPLAVIPVGTANDFARALEIPDDPAEASRIAATGTSVRKLDLGRADGRPFVNVASLGLAPAAAQRAENVKEALGKFAYGVGAVQAAAVEDPIACTVTGDGKEIFTGEIWQVIVGCTGAFGGGSEIDAEPTDGMLDVVVIEAGPRPRLARHAVGLRAGNVEKQPGVSQARACEVQIDVDDGGCEYNVDGEVVELGSASFGIDPAAFGILIG